MQGAKKLTANLTRLRDKGHSDDVEEPPADKKPLEESRLCAEQETVKAIAEHAEDEGPAADNSQKEPV